MRLRFASLLLPISCAVVATLGGCTSVKVDRVTQEKYAKIPAKDVSQSNPDEASHRPHTKIATVDMRTSSPFAANLNTLAHERTGKLGGNAYVITGGTASSSISGSFIGLFADKTEASMNIDVLRWAAPPPGAAAAPAVAAAQTTTAPATAVPAVKKKRWYWPFG